MAPGESSSTRPHRVAIIGSGPSGFYTAQHLLARKERVIEVDMFDRLPTPFGLVRYGVAPDHQKVKSVAKAYTRTATAPGFRFFGGVEMGSDLSRDELRELYDQIVYTTGAQTDRRLGIPGEDLRGSHPATEFVAWYNGHPDYRNHEFDLSCEKALVVGVGNVAIDVARILSRSIDELARTDIADYALEALRESRVREVQLLGRRGPAQAAFTNTEVKEIGELEAADAVTLAAEAELDAVSRAQLDAQPSKVTEKKVQILQGYSRPIETPRARRLVVRFLVSPVEILGDARGAVQGVRLVHNELYETDAGVIRPRATEQYEELPAGLVFRSVGYRGMPLTGVPFRDDWGTIPHERGRVLEEPGGAEVTGEYVAGWIKRGPTGVIGTNKPDALESVTCMMEDLDLGRTTGARSGADAVVNLLRERAVRYFTFEDWQRLNALEVASGVAAGRPRVKFVSAEAMREALQS